MELVDGRPLSDFIKENGHLDYKNDYRYCKAGGFSSSKLRISIRLYIEM